MKIFLLALFALILPNVSHAQLWSGVIDPARAIDWTGAGVVGGIPTRTTICTTLGTAGQLPTFSQSVPISTINPAISACSSGGVVLLNPGPYTFATSTSNVGIEFYSKNNVTLRG